MTAGRRARWLARQACRLVLLGILLLEVLYLGRALWLQDLLRAQVAALLEEALGGKASFGEIRDEGFRHVRCSGIGYQGQGVLREVRGGELDLWLDPGRVLDGGLGFVRAVRVRADHVALDLDALRAGPGDGAGPASAPDERLWTLCPDGVHLFVDRLTVRARGQVLAGPTEVTLPPRRDPRTVRATVAAPGVTATLGLGPGADLTVEAACTGSAAWLGLFGVELPAGITPGAVRMQLTANRERAHGAVHAEATLPEPLAGPCRADAEVSADAAAIRLGSLTVEGGAFRAEGEASLDLGTAALLAEPGRALQAPLRVVLSLSRGELARIGTKALGLPAFHGSVTGRLGATGTLLAPVPRLDLAVELSRVTAREGVAVAAAGRVRADLHTVRLEDFAARTAQHELRVEGMWQSPAPLWQGPLRGELMLSARSPDGAAVDAACALDRLGLRQGEFAARLPGLRVRGQGLELPAKLLAAPPAAWAFARGTLAVELDSVAALRGWRHAPLLPGLERLPDDLSLDARLALGDGWLDVLALHARGAGLELLAAPSSVPLAAAGDGHAALWLKVHEPPRLPLPEGLPPPREGTVALDLRGHAGHVAADARVDLHLRDGTRSGRLHGSVALQGGATVARFPVAFAPDLTLAAVAPEGSGTLQTTGLLFADAWPWRPAAVALQFVAEGRPAKDLGAPGSTARLNAHLRADGQRIRGTFTVSQDRLRAEGSAELLGGTVQDLVTSPAVLCAAPLLGTARFHDLELSAFDFRALGLSDLAGRASGEIELQGTLQHPDPRVVLEIADGSVRAPGLQRLEQLEGQVTASATRVDFTRLKGTAGLGPLSIHGSVVAGTTFREGFAGTRVDLSLSGTDVLLYRRGGIKVRADLDVRARGPLDALALEGRVDVHSARYVARIPYWNPSRQGGSMEGLVVAGPELPPGLGVRLDVAITTREPFRVDTNVFKTRISGALRLTGPLEAPLLLGDLTAGDGTLALPGMTLQLQTMLVHLDQERPRFPAVTLRAQGRRHSHDVTLLVTGRLDELEIMLSSTPILTSEQLAVLVTTGAPPTATGRDKLMGAGTAVGTYLVEEIADSLFGSESTEEKESFLSRLRVETGTEVSRTGNESILAEFRVFDRVYLQGEQDVFGDMNLGVVYRVKFR